MPFPSLACDTCKKRRIKCDETQPICLRCTKSHRQCHGMKTGADSIIHTENAFASGSLKRPRGPRPQQSSTLSPLDSLSPILQPDLKTQAIAYYLHHHVQPLHDAPSISKSIEDDIESIFISHPTSSTIHLAISVIALVLFGKTQNIPQATIDACTSYQTLLGKIQKAVSSPTECDVEECLFAIFCMGRYEDTVHSEGQPLTHLWAFRSAFHHDGALAVLKAFKDRRAIVASNSPLNSISCASRGNNGDVIPDIVKHTRRGMIKSAIMRNLSLPSWILNGRDFGESEDLELEYDAMLVRLIDLRYRLRSSKQHIVKNMNKPSQQTALEVQEIVKECQELDAELSSWPSHFPPNWERSENAREGVRYFTYQNLAYASIWTKLYATRILVLGELLAALTLSPPPNSTASLNTTYDELITQSKSRQSATAHLLKSSLPFCLGHPNIPVSQIKDEDIPPITIRWLAWPLTMCIFAEELDGLVNDLDDVQQENHKAFFMNELVRLGRRVGIGALAGAEEIIRGVNVGSDVEGKDV